MTLRITKFTGSRMHLADFLIQETGYTYPVLIEDVSRSDIGSNQQKALQLLHQQT